MGKIEIEGLKGLNIKDRDEWLKEAFYELKKTEPTFNYNIDDVSEEDKTMIYFNSMFKEKFGDRSDYNVLKTFNDEEAVNFWNTNYETEQNIENDIINRYTVESGDSFGINSTKASPDRDFGRLIAGDKSTDYDNDGVEFDFNMLPKFEGLFSDKVVEDSEDEYFNQKIYKNDEWYYYNVDKNSKNLRAFFDDTNHKRQTYEAYKTFDKIADNVSNIYKNFKNSDTLGLTFGDVKDVMSNYYSILGYAGEDEANMFLSNYMQDKLAKNQSFGEKLWNGFKGMGASAVSSAVMLYGVADAIFSGEAFNSEDYNENVGAWANFWNKVINNDITRYANDILKYQSYKKEDIEALKERGLVGNIYKTVQEEQGSLGDKIWSINFIPDMIQQHGFTVTSAFVSFGTSVLSKGIGGLSKVAKEGTKAIIKKEAKDLSIDVVKQFFKEGAKKGEAVGGFFGAGLAGTSEAVMNSLDVNDSVYQEGLRLINEEFGISKEDREKKFEEWMQKEHPEIYEEFKLYNDSKGQINLENSNTTFDVLKSKFDYYWEEYNKTYLDRVEELKASAIRAQNTAFTANQIINGFLNVSLKAAALHPSVKKLGKNSKSMFGLDDAGNVVNPSKLKKTIKVGWKTIEEATGEGIEELSTEIVGGYAEAAGISDFEHYLQNGVGDYGKEAVDRAFAASLIGADAFSGAWDKFTDANSWYAFVSGAASSSISIGNPIGLYNAYTISKDNPNLSKADKYKLWSSAFLRSSFVENYKSAVGELQREKNHVEELSKFIKDPQNLKLYNNAIEVTNFSIQRNLSTNSELEYRNSNLGTTIATINALEDIKEYNPHLYRTHITNLQNLANLSNTNENFKKEQIDAYRSLNLVSDDTTDEEIIERISKNAKELQGFRESVIKNRKKVKEIHGENLDSDVLNSLVFGEITYENYGNRINQMNEEINQSYNKGKTNLNALINPEDAETLTNEEKQHLIKYGNRNESRNLQNRLNNDIEDLEYKIFKLEKNKSEAKKNSKKLKDLKSQLESKQQELKDFNKSFDKVKDSLTDKKLLTDDDIMNLSNEDRAYVMSKEFYDKSSYDQAYILDYLNNVLDAGDNYTSNKSVTKIQDVGKLEKSRRLHEDVRKMSRRSLTNYAQTVKYNSYDNMSKQSVESLKDVKDYKDFKKLYYGLVNNSNQLLASLNRKNVKTILKDNEHYKTLQNSQRLTRLYFNKLTQALNNESIIKNLEDNDYPVTSEARNKFLIMASYLSENNIDIKDVDNINRMLTFERLNEYFNNLPEVTERLSFNAKDIDAFKKIINNAREEVQQIEDINKPVEVTRVDNSQTFETESLFNDPTIVVYDNASEEKITDIDTDLLNKSDEDIIKHLAEIIKNNQLNVAAFRPMIKKCFHNTKHRQESLSLLLYCVNNNIQNINSLKDEDLKKISSDTNISFKKLYPVKNIISGFQIDNNTGESINGEQIDNNILSLIKKYLSDNNQQNAVKKPQIDISYQNKRYNLPVLNLDDEDVKTYGVVDFLNKAKDTTKKPIKFIGNKDKGKIYVCVYVTNEEKGRTYIKNNYQVISIIPTKQNADESNNNYTQDLLNDLRSKFQSYTNNDSFFEIESDKKFIGFATNSNTAKHSTTEQYSIQEQLDKSKTVKEEDFIKRLVVANQKYDSKDKAVKLTYTSPINKKQVTVEEYFDNDGNSKSKTDRDLLLYISPKQTPESGKDNGETIIEIFVKSLKNYKFKNGQSVLEFFKTENAKSLANVSQSNYIFSQYFIKLCDSLNELKNLDYHLTGDESLGYNLTIDSKNTLDNKIKDLNNHLRRYLNLSNYEYGYKINNDGYIDLILKDSKGEKVTNCNIHFYKINRKPSEEFKITDEAVFNFFKNCIIDNGKLRENDKGEILYKFQVDYLNIDSAKKGYESRNKTDNDKTQDEKINELNLHITESLIREGILFSNKNTLDRQNISVTLYSKASEQQTKKPQDVTMNGTEAKDVYTEESKPIFNWEQTVNGKIEDIRKRLKQFLFDKNNINNNNHDNSTRSVTSTIYNSSRYYDNEVSKEIGNIYDRAIRKLINDKTVTTEQMLEDFGFSRKELDNIINIVKKLKSEFPGYVLDAREFMIEFTDENGEQLIGIPDIIAYNSDGEIVIIDIKTINRESDLLKENNWKTQVNKYGYGLNQIVSDIGAEVKQVGIVKIPVTYDNNVQLVDGKLNSQGESYNSFLESGKVEILTSEYSSKSPDVTEGLTEDISLNDEFVFDVGNTELSDFDDINLDEFMPSDNLTEFENKQRTDCA